MHEVLKLISYFLLGLYCLPQAMAGHDSEISRLFNAEKSKSEILKPGEIFQDVIRGSELAPKMVVIPAGSFIMGSPEDEVGRYADEGPRHKVVFSKPFALGVTEITVGEFSQFVKETGYETDAENNGGSWIKNPDPDFPEWAIALVDWRYDHLGQLAPPNYPVVHVTWNDVKAYVSWLANSTGQPYRLPTEAEFEYANRAGTQSRYWWGDDSPEKPAANIRGVLEIKITPPQVWTFTEAERAHASEDGPTWMAFPGHNDGFGGLAPVASFPANAFKLHDTTGNVWEWLEDCYVENYDGAPTDGSVRIISNCETRVLRGGSFYCFPRHVRSANRWSRTTFTRGMYTGFRLARDL